MNTAKKINVNFSSLVGLKAELLRKQAEIKDAKTKQDGQPRVSKPKVKRKRIKENVEKVDGNYTEIEDVATLKKSRIMLEAKSMLYEKLKKTGVDEARGYLVDFANKSDESDNEIYKDEDYDDVNSDPEDDWVEYQDCFGRTRKCLRRDLPKMKEKDNLVKREVTKEHLQECETRAEEKTELKDTKIDKEPEIEIMRRKWEEQMKKLADKSEIHYQDILFDEARAHGVGYYAFSQNEEERAKQQENLSKLRKDTEQQQKEFQEIRDLKNNMEFNRLKAAMIRQKIRSGQSAELTKEEEEELRSRIKSRNSDTQEEETSPEAMEAAAKRTEEIQKNREDNSLIVVEDKIKAFGELLGKRPKWHEMSQEEWIYKRRKDRLGEFAPVYENFRRSNCTDEISRDSRITTRNDEEKDPVRIDSTAPEPTDVWETQGPSYQEEDIKEEKLEVEKTEETAKKDSSIRENNLDTASIVKDADDEDEDGDDDDDDDIIGPLPPSSSGKNFTPATFINSFVPQPMSTAPSMPVPFDRSAPPPMIINFSIPPPSIVPLIPKSLPTAESKIVNVVMQKEDSSNSDDSVIIGPVPPPSIDDFSQFPVQNCGPRLIDNDCINIISDIPLPSAVQFPQTYNYTSQSIGPSQNLTTNGTNVISNDLGNNSSGNLDVDKISVGLKYLRKKFDETIES